MKLNLIARVPRMSLHDTKLPIRDDAVWSLSRGKRTFAGHLPWNSPGGRRNTDAHLACAALHVKSCVDHPVAGVLVLDVGRAWGDLGRSDAGHSEDHF